MKRFHVHLHVEHLPASIAFYSKLFGAEPSRIEADYAKWMIDDPRLNFAISTRGTGQGIDHLGIQADSAEELAELKARAEAADLALLDEGSTTCCYARSDKHWLTDPQGIAWEHFHSLGSIPVFSEGEPGDAATGLAATATTACCPPSPRAASEAQPEPRAARGKPVGIGIAAVAAGSCKPSSGCC
jgi:lactoylglutathione lyase